MFQACRFSTAGGNTAAWSPIPWMPSFSAPISPLSPLPPTMPPQSQQGVRTAVPIQDLTYPSSIDNMFDLGGQHLGPMGSRAMGVQLERPKRPVGGDSVPGASSNSSKDTNLSSKTRERCVSQLLK